MKRHHKNYLTGAVGLAIIAFLLVAVLYNQLMNLYETNTAGPPSESLTVLVLKEKKGMSEPCPEGSDGFATRNLTGQENTSVDYCQQKLSDSPEFVTIAVSKAYDAICERKINLSKDDASGQSVYAFMLGKNIRGTKRHACFQFTQLEDAPRVMPWGRWLYCKPCS